MRGMNLVGWVAGMAAIVAVAIAVLLRNEGRSARAELASARGQPLELEKRISEMEEKLRRAERFASEAEQDRRDLLKALESIRARPQLPASSPAAIVGTSRDDPGKSSREEPPSEEEQARLAHERWYAQTTARKRKEDAMQRAKFEELLAPVRDDPEAKFNERIKTVEFYAARGEIQVAIRIFNEALAEKPSELPFTDQAKAVQATLRGQNVPVEVTWSSDGQTFVSVIAVRSLGKFVTNVVKILPGNYEIVGRRAGFREVVMPLVVRNGQPPPAVSVICSEPLEK